MSKIIYYTTFDFEETYPDHDVFFPQDQRLGEYQLEKEGDLSAAVWQNCDRCIKIESKP